MTEIEKDLLKERILQEIYDKVGLTPTNKELEASHEAFSDALVEKLCDMALGNIPNN